VPDISHLPPILQVVVTMFVLVIGGLITWSQFSSRWLAKLPAPVRPAPATTDTVVVSGAFADGAPIRELVAINGRMLLALEAQTAATHLATDEQARTTAATLRLMDSVDALGRIVARVHHSPLG
jgi:hypothetical protein